MKLYLFVTTIIIITFLGCKKEDKVPTDNWKLTVLNLTDDGLTLKWQNCIDTTLVSNYYQLYIDNKLTNDSIYGTSVTNSKLKNNTRYMAKIVAISNKTHIDSCSQSFLTKINHPPTDLTFSLDSLTYNSVIVNRSDAFDPEHKPLNYEIYVNGVLQPIVSASKHVIVRNLTPNTRNNIKLCARDDANNTIYVESSVVTPATENSLLYRYYIVANGKKRECVMYLPTNYKQSSNLPLLFFFHGSGSYAWDISQLTRFRDIADSENVVLAYPQATIFDVDNLPSWCVDPNYTSDDLPFASKLIDDLLGNFSINPKRVYACGMSSGGYMSFYMGLFLTDKIAAIAPVAAAPTRYNFGLKTINRPLPLLYIYGTEDSGISGSGWALSVKETLYFWVTNNSCESTPIETLLPNVDNSNYSTVTLFEYPNPNKDNRILYYRINGGGHWWPGRDYAPTDIIAETVIWDFFKPISKP